MNDPLAEIARLQAEKEVGLKQDKFEEFVKLQRDNPQPPKDGRTKYVMTKDYSRLDANGNPVLVRTRIAV